MDGQRWSTKRGDSAPDQVAETQVETRVPGQGMMGQPLAHHACLSKDISRLCGELQSPGFFQVLFQAKYVGSNLT